MASKKKHQAESVVASEVQTNGYSNYDEMERWDNTLINVRPQNIPPPPSADPSSVNTRPQANERLAFSGSVGKLGVVLEKMHQGHVLSQHDVSAALRDYNQMQITMNEQQRKLERLRMQTYPEDSEDIPMPSAIIGKPSKSIQNSDAVIMSKKEKEKLLAQIERKDKLISELQNRLKNLANTKTKKLLNRDVDISDLAPPARLVDGFCDLYSREWSDAYDTLKAAWKDEEKSVFTLFRVIRHIYVFCYDISEDQRQTVSGFSDNLQETMLHPSFVHPVSKLKYRASAVVSDEAARYSEIGRKLIGEYRNILVTQSVAGVQEIFRKVKLPEIFESGFVNTSIRQFVDKAVELIWLMVIQDPPMMLYWLEPKRQIIRDYFNFFDDKGDYCKQTVWPAVFLKEDGAILSKGVIMAET